MKTTLLLACGILGFLSLSAQFDLSQYQSNQDFPIYQPNLNAQDNLANVLPYYYADPAYSADTCKVTVQYAFGPVFWNGPSGGTRNPLDNNSTYDMYCSTYSTQDQCTNGKPLAIILHGGGGSKGDDRIIRAAMEYAKRGYIAIVPDYTVGADIYADESSLTTVCPSLEETWWLTHYAVRDIRGVIRKALCKSQGLPNDSCFAKINPSQIFLQGFSGGAFTSLHLALTNNNTVFGLDPVMIEGVSRSFTHLNSLNIGEPECNVLGSGYKIEDNIRGLSLSSGGLLDSNLIKASYNIPTIFFHGSCDASVPIYKATAYNNFYTKWKVNNLQNDDSAFPCLSSTDLNNYSIYGSAWTYARLETLQQSNFKNVALFQICGLRHQMNQYSLKIGQSKIGIVEYETFRLFGQSIAALNNSSLNVPSFKYTLDHTLRVDNNPTAAADHCDVVPSEGSTNELAGPYYDNVQCGRCNSSGQGLSYIRFPFFRKSWPINNSISDAQRYLPLNIFTANGGSEICGPSEIAEQSSSNLTNTNKISVDEAPINTGLVQWYNHAGMFLGNMKLENGETSIEEILPLLPSLPNGFYFIHLPDGERKAMVIQ